MDIVAPSPTSVYRYYDARGVLLYVGITSRGTQRNREHNATKEWWQLVARQDVMHFPSRDAALKFERAAIQSHRPPFNRQHNPSHRESRAAYLLLGQVNSDQSASLGGTPADRRARRQMTLLSHRLPLKKCADTERTVSFRAPNNRALAIAVNFYGTVVLRGPRKLGEFERTKIGPGGDPEFVFRKTLEAPMPARVTLKLRVTQNPLTIWAYEAVA